MTDAWLDDVVIVNESRDERQAGDVSIFRNAMEACGWLEHWWVENGEGFAFTAAGDRLMLAADNNDRVYVADRQEVADGSEIVRGWLLATATALLETRRAKVGKGKLHFGAAEKNGELPASIEGLIAYLGFNS